MRTLEGNMNFTNLLSDLNAFIEHGGRFDRVLIIIPDKDILATGIARYDNGFCLEFNSYRIRDFFKRRAFKVFCNENNLQLLEKWKAPECITPRADLPANE